MAKFNLGKCAFTAGLAFFSFFSTKPATATSFQHERWETQQTTYADNQQWFVGDFNCDGKSDIGKVWNDDGLASVDVHLSTGTSFTPQRWATQVGVFNPSNQRWIAGQFHNGPVSNCYASLAVVYPSDHFLSGGNPIPGVFDQNVAIDRFHNYYGSFSGLTRVCCNAPYQFDENEKWTVGDPNGDGNADIYMVFNNGGHAAVDVYDSQNFASKYRAMSSGGDFWDSQKWMGAGTTLVNVFNDYGYASVDLYWNLHSGGAYNQGLGMYSRRATQQGGYWDSQKWVVGDFNGDGAHDLAKAFNDYGLISIDVHLNSGGLFYMSRAVTQSGGYADNERFLAGDFDGDGFTDIALVWNDWGYNTIDVFKNLQY